MCGTRVGSPVPGQPGTVVQACNPSPQMEEAGGSKFKVNLGYTSGVEVCPGLHEACLKKIKHRNNAKCGHILSSTFFEVFVYEATCSPVH